MPVAVLAIAIAYPYYSTHMPQVPIFGPFPQVSTMVVMMIFTMMALGLNFVVGYAGLLDLGYVAFYAMGAYMAGWFASSQFAEAAHQLRRGRPLPGGTGYPLLDLARAADGGHRDGDRRRADRAADAAAARRLSRDRHARLRRDHAADRAQRRQPLRTGFNLTNGTGGITPIDGPGFGNWAAARICTCRRTTSTRRTSTRVFFWTALVLVLITVFC